MLKKNGVEFRGRVAIGPLQRGSLRVGIRARETTFMGDILRMRQLRKQRGCRPERRQPTMYLRMRFVTGERFHGKRTRGLSAPLNAEGDSRNVSLGAGAIHSLGVAPFL